MVYEVCFGPAELDQVEESNQDLRTFLETAK